MKVTISKDALAKGLNLVNRAVSTRSTLPVLSNILIATDGPRLRLAATNLEVAITTWLEASVDIEGSITIPAKTFTDVVGTIASGDSVFLTLKKDTLTLKASGTKTEIKGIPAEEFPLLPRGESLEIDPVEFEAADLHNVIRKTTFCAATDEVRPMLRGVCFKAKDGYGAFAATDGFRLAVMKLSVKAEIGAIIPAESLNQLDRVLDDESPVMMRVSSNQGQVIFTTATVELVSQLIEGRFPNYESIIPTDNQVAAEVNTGELLAAIKAIDVFARHDSHIAYFVFSQDSLMLRGESPERGSGTATVTARLFGATADKLPLEIAFNARYIIDALKAIGDQCVINLKDKHSAALLTPSQSNGFEMVIMPMAINR